MVLMSSREHHLYGLFAKWHMLAIGVWAQEFYGHQQFPAQGMVWKKAEVMEMEENGGSCDLRTVQEVKCLDISDYLDNEVS